MAIFQSFLILALFFTLYSDNKPARRSEVFIPPAYQLKKVLDLPPELSESSGIILYDSLLWSFNDSGGDAIIYGVNLTTGTISRTIEISDAKNKDWEDIAHNDDYIYIGDFGNNDGSRKDLKIYYIPKKDITTQQHQVIASQTIHFSYADQEDFTPAMFANQYDCEAMIATDDSLYLFTKDWLNLQTNIYSLPSAGGEFKAKYIGYIESEGLVTGADFDSEKKKFVLCGYNLFYPFIIVVESINDLKVLSRIEFEEISGLQIEGITFISDDRFYVTNEKSSENQALYQIITESIQHMHSD